VANKETEHGGMSAPSVRNDGKGAPDMRKLDGIQRTMSGANPPAMVQKGAKAPVAAVPDAAVPKTGTPISVTKPK
jgi:hypothetical protein